MEEQLPSDEELRRRNIKGEISDDEYLAGIEKNCKHVGEIEDLGNSWIEWCKNCGKRLDSGSVGSGTVKVKGGCAVVALLLLGIVLAGLYGFVELMT